MNRISKIEGQTYYELERLQQLMNGESIVICTDATGKKFTCLSTVWDSNSIEEISTPAIIAKVNSRSTPAEKITLFRSLFRGREDVYARRYYSPKTDSGGYAPACKNEWVVGICDKKAGSCVRCPNRTFLPLTDDVIYKHLEGKDRYNRDVIGLYPILGDDITCFLAIDFDGDDWKRDIDAFRIACSELGLETSIERSRSGNGAHVWFFFEDPVPAVTARKFGSGLLTRAMDKRHEIKFKSYDRLFPNQDTLPKGGFGNLIALPLQGRARKQGNSVFIDESFVAFID